MKLWLHHLKVFGSDYTYNHPKLLGLGLHSPWNGHKKFLLERWNTGHASRHP